MKYQLLENGAFTILELSGEIDLHYSPELRKLILSVYKNHLSLEISLQDVTYIDSSGVACFVEAYQLSKKKNLEFSLSNISSSAMQVIKLARLDTVFPIK